MARGKWLKKMFPKLYAKKQARQIEDAKQGHSNVNVALENKSKELDEQIKNTKSKMKINKLKAEKSNIDNRRRYDASASGDAQMSIDKFVVERTKLKEKIAELEAVDTSSMNTPDKTKLMNDLNASKGRLGDIQKNINELWKVAKKHKTKKIVEKSTPKPKIDRDITIYDDEAGESRVPVTKVNEFDESYDY